MTEHDHDAIDRAGVGFVQYQIPKLIGWIFREQATSDYGVDAHVEVVTASQASGRLVGLQIKTGKSRFVAKSENGWIYRPSTRHVDYWLRHSLPVYLLLVDTDKEAIHWQILDESTITRGPRGGRIVEVPETNTIHNVKEHWEQAASLIGSEARMRFEENLGYLPPSVSKRLVKLHEAAKIPSEWLAAHLALGRSAPELTARTLLANSPSWMADLGPEAWLIVGNYAYSHDAALEAADAYVRAAELNPDSEGRMRFSAGGAIAAVDPDRARDLFVQASGSQDAAALGELGLAALELGTNAGARPDQELIVRLQALTDDVVALSFLARHSSNLGHRDEAICLWESALALDPENAEIFCGLSTDLERRARSADRHPLDLARARDLAQDAVEQIHRWSGPSLDALKHLLHLLVLDNDHRGILDRALAAPRGQATFTEASDPEILTAAVLAADGLVELELVGELLTHLPEGTYRDFARASLSENDRLPAADRESLWQNVIDGLDARRPRELAIAVTRLAHVGVDATDRLVPLVHAQLVAADRVDLLRSIAAAVNDLDNALPSFRAQADLDEKAAYTLIQLLQDAGRTEAAITAAGDAATRFSEPRFSLLQADLLCAESRFDDASEVLEATLRQPELSDSLRLEAHTFLAKRAAHSGNSAQMRQHYEAALSTGEPGRRFNSIAWLLVETYLRLSQTDMANDLIKQHHLVPTTPAEGRVWAWAVSAEPITEELAGTMLVLALRFSEDPLLSGNLLTSIIVRTRDADPGAPVGPLDDRVAVTDEIRRHAFEELDRHIDAHGSATPVRRLRSDSPDELRAQLFAELERVNRPITEAVDLAASGEIPQGLLAMAAGRSLAYMLAGRLLGLYVSGSFIDEECSAEDAAVAAALNEQVAVDTSALMVGSLLGDFPRLRGHFRRVFLPRECLDDIETAKSEIRGLANSSGTMGWDAVREQPIYLDPDVDHQLATIGRLKMLEQAVLHTVQTEVANLPEFGREDAHDHAVWLSPVALAKEQGCALWSDDIAVRKVARSLGVPSFSTLSLLEHLAARRIEATAEGDAATLEDLFQQRRQEMRTAVQERVVDVPIGIEELVGEGADTDFRFDLAQCTVGRPGWWILTTDMIGDLDTLLMQIEDADTANTWRAIAMLGAAQMGRWDKKRASICVTLVALIGHRGVPSHSEIATLMRTAADIGGRHQVNDLGQTLRAVADVPSGTATEWFSEEFLQAVLEELGSEWVAGQSG